MILDVKCLCKHLGMAGCILLKVLLAPFVKTSGWIEAKMAPKDESKLA